LINYKVSDAILCRQRGAEMIGLLGPAGRPAIPSVITSLAMDNCAAEAERALLRCGDASVPYLTRALTDRNADLRCRAAKLLSDFPNVPPVTIEALIQLAADRESAVRRQSAETLGKLAPTETSALLRLASDPAAEVRAAAMEALAKGESSAPVLITLRHGLEDADVGVRLQSAKALWQLTRETRTTVPVLTRILTTREGWQAAYALAQMGEAAAPAVPGLVEALHRERVPRPYRTPPSCAFALGQIAGPAIPALRPLLESNDARSRLNALMAFGFMGLRGRDAVPELLPMLHDRDSEVRHAAALTLANIGAEKGQIIAGLSACLSAEDIYMRSSAAQVLREIAPDQTWVVNPE
jgi:HEAT repeat protein